MVNKVLKEQNRKVTLSVTIKKQIRDKLESYCVEDKISRSQVVEDALDDYIDELRAVDLNLSDEDFQKLMKNQLKKSKEFTELLTKKIKEEESKK